MGSFLQELRQELFDFSRGNRNEFGAIALWSLFYRRNYLVPEKDEHIPFPLLRKVLKMVLRVWRDRVDSDRVHFRTPRVHINDERGSVLAWQAFVQKEVGVEPGASFNSHDLVGHAGGGSRFRLTGTLIRWYFTLWALWRSNGELKRGLLLLPEVLVMLCNIRTLFGSKEAELERVFFSGGYEPHSNLLSYAFAAHGVQFDLIVSGTPLFRTIHRAKCDRFYLTNPYQEEELKAYGEHYQYEDTILLPPFSYRDYLDRYIEEKKPNRGTIGVYTSGSWKRKAEGKDREVRIAEQEVVIFKALDSLLEKGALEELILFLHPNEKRTEQDLKDARKFYGAYFEHFDKVVLYDRKEPSTHCFDRVDIGVTTISNITFERLFCGFKVLMVPFRNEVPFPVPGSPLNKIAAFDQDGIETLFREMKDRSASSYFDRKGLEGYTWWKYRGRVPYLEEKTKDESQE